MGDVLCILFLLAIPFLTIPSIVLVVRWKHFVCYILGYFFVLSSGIYVINFTPLINVGSDPYGLGRLVLNAGFLLSHIFLGFLLSLLIRFVLISDKKQ